MTTDNTIVKKYINNILKSLHGIHETKIDGNYIEVVGTITEDLFKELFSTISNPYDISFLKINYKKEIQNMVVD